MSDISQQLIELVAAARADGRHLNIVGRNSKHFFGRQPSGDTLEVSGHQGIVSYQPAELVMTVRAGTSLATMEAALDEQEQMLSFEPPNFGTDASIGGTLACNQSGPSRPWSGSIRDMVLGLRLINGKAEHLRFGGQVMKNVAGYDISRLQAGALGCLGVITEISLKVLPKPAASLTLVGEIESADEAIELMNRLPGTAAPLSGACWLAKKLHLRFEGAISAVDSAAQRLQKLLPGAEVLEDGRGFWHQLREQQLEFFQGDTPLYRCSVASSLPHFLPEAEWLIDWGGAQRWLRIDSYNLQTLNAEIERGEASLFRYGDRQGEVTPQPAAAIKTLHQRLKNAFDPDHVFNPGRLFSWL